MSLEHGRPTDAGYAPRLLSWAKLLELVPYTQQHISRLIAAGKWPAPVVVGPNRVAFIESEIASHIASLPRGRITQNGTGLERHNERRRRKARERAEGGEP